MWKADDSNLGHVAGQDMLTPLQDAGAQILLCGRIKTEQANEPNQTSRFDCATFFSFVYVFFSNFVKVGFR